MDKSSTPHYKTPPARGLLPSSDAWQKWLLWTVAMEFLCVSFGATMSGPDAITSTHQRYPRDTHSQSPLSGDALQRLQGVFRIDSVPINDGLLRHHTPPEFMTSLYDRVAYQNGVTKQENPHQADMVRSMPDRASHGDTFHYIFNASHIKDYEEIKEAEFRIFRMRGSSSAGNEVQRRSSKLRGTHHTQLNLYEILSVPKGSTSGSYRFLSRRTLSSYGHGWEVFNITEVVRKWKQGGTGVHGFMVTTSTGQNISMENSTAIRIAQRHEHHDSKQPIIIVYSMENYNQTLAANQNTEFSPSHHPAYKEYVQFMNEGYRAQHGPYRGPIGKDRRMTSSHKDVRRDKVNKSSTATSPYHDRRRRSLDYYRYSKRKKRTCARHDLYVDFAEIGWSGWIISPKGYDAYHCKGECPFPLGQNQKPTNHATVQSIVHALNIGQHVTTPCCVPNKLYSISLLYFDDDENVILKQYDDMVAVGCGCH